jgi:hypothetical protein
MGVPNATKFAAINAVSGLGSWVNVLTGAGGTTGANEASTTRVQTTWPSNANPVTGSTVTVGVAPAGTYVEFGVWSALTSGTFVYSQAFAGGNVVVSGSGALILITPSITF